jgi:hypothetical protein
MNLNALHHRVQFIVARLDTRDLAPMVKDENGTEISRTDRFRFLYYDSVFKHKKLSVSIGFTTIFNHFLYSLIAKM